MANIPIRDIPGAVVASPDPSNLIPMDNGSLMQKTTIANAVNTTLPLSSQSEAEAGVDNAKRMSPLRTKQAIDAQTPAIVNVAITALNLGTMSQEDASDYTPTSGLAAVALSNDYNDLDSLPTLGTAAATDASDYATAAQGALADTAVQPGNAALVPAGGTTGQVLVKDSDTDYDTGWVSSAAATAVSYAPQTLTEPQKAQARGNIGLGNSATRNVGTTAGTVAAGDDGRITGAASKTYVDGKILGVGQTWQNMLASRSSGTSYQNTTGRPIMVSVQTGIGGGALQVSIDNSAWISVAGQSTAAGLNRTTIVPIDAYYRLDGSATPIIWAELR